jgi:lipopolysaccharide/colanic/teichoic acid biosynthesis glycosyltransferase
MRKRAMQLDGGGSSATPTVPSYDQSADVVVDVREEAHTRVDLSRATVPAPRGLLEAPRWKLAVKRAIDVVLSLLLIVLLSPFMLVTIVVIRVASPGPALLPQARIGRGGRPFMMFKFRSMRVGAHEVREDYAELNETGGPVFKIKRDPRITGVGALLRRLSLDELPQLGNVLRGEMSLVGPRPPLPEEVAQYTPHQRQRLSVRPGMTCIWQVSGRSEIDFDRWVELDLRYIREWTLGMDVRLLFRTIPAVISGHGAY